MRLFLPAVLHEAQFSLSTTPKLTVQGPSWRQIGGWCGVRRPGYLLRVELGLHKRLSAPARRRARCKVQGSLEVLRFGLGVESQSKVSSRGQLEGLHEPNLNLYSAKVDDNSRDRAPSNDMINIEIVETK